MQRRFFILPLLVALVAACLTISSRAEDAPALTAEQFLSIARKPPLLESWAKMDGEVMHSTGGRTIHVPIRFRARFSPSRILAKIELAGAERFAVSQIFADGMAGTSVLPEVAAKPNAYSLNSLGLRPSDLTLGFLYWNLVEELEPTSVKTQACRVFRLQHPETEESVEVAIATEFFFPMRVLWFGKGESASNRRLEFTNFKRKGDIWVVNEALISSKGWKSRVRFSKVEVEEVTPEAPEPDDLFKLGE